MYIRPFKQKSWRSVLWDKIGTRKKIVSAPHDPRHDTERERLTASAQFNCEGCQ